MARQPMLISIMMLQATPRKDSKTRARCTINRLLARPGSGLPSFFTSSTARLTQHVEQATRVTCDNNRQLQCSRTARCTALLLTAGGPRKERQAHELATHAIHENKNICLVHAQCPKALLQLNHACMNAQNENGHTMQPRRQQTAAASRMSNRTARLRRDRRVACVLAGMYSSTSGARHRQQHTAGALLLCRPGRNNIPPEQPQPHARTACVLHNGLQQQHFRKAGTHMHVKARHSRWLQV